MRQKLITLDPTSFERAQKKNNFSKWIREQLQLEADGMGVEFWKKDYERMYESQQYWYKKYQEVVKAL